MPTITQLQSYKNELQARLEQLSDRLYYTAEEEEARRPALQEKINEVNAQLGNDDALKNIEVINPTQI